MSRRNQSRRRRSYGRREHEVRERRPELRDLAGWNDGADNDDDTGWQAADGVDERASYGETFGGFGQ